MQEEDRSQILRVEQTKGGYWPRPGIVVPALNAFLHLLGHAVVSHVCLGTILYKQWNQNLNIGLCALGGPLDPQR